MGEEASEHLYSVLDRGNCGRNRYVFGLVTFGLDLAIIFSHGTREKRVGGNTNHKQNGYTRSSVKVIICIYVQLEVLPILEKGQ